MSKRSTWSKDETDFLYSLIGDMPIVELAVRFRYYAARRGWPTRSMKAIQLKIFKMGESTQSTGSSLTSGGVASILGCPPDRVTKWITTPRIAKILKPRRYNRVYFVSRSDWRRLARERPQVLGGFSVERLYALLEDRKLAEQIARMYRAHVGDFRVRCVETGRIWSSACAAARDLHVSRETISVAIRQRRSVPSLGLTFEALRQAREPAA